MQLLRKEPGWSNMGRLHTDYSNCRAYFLQNAGFKVLVEPSVDRRRGVWSLTIGSCVQIFNACSATLRIYEGRPKRNLGGEAVHCFRSRGGREVRRAELGHYIDVYSNCKKSIPLSWFGAGRVPAVSLLLSTEDAIPGSADAEESDDEELQVPPVAFTTLYRLLNKTGCTYSSRAFHGALAECPDRTRWPPAFLSSLAFVGADEQPRRLDIPSFSLRLRGALMLHGSLDATDIPSSEPSRIAQRYLIRLEPMLRIRNTLPFPVSVSVMLKNTPSDAGGSRRGWSETREGSARAVSDGAAGPEGEGGLFEDLEAQRLRFRRRQNQKPLGDAAKLLTRSCVEALIPPHQSWVSLAASPLSLRGCLV